MAAFIYGIPPVQFWEAMEGSQDCAISRNAQTYKAIWKVQWDDAEAAKVVLLGKTTAMPAFGAAPAYWSRALPHAHPKAPWLFATDVVRTEGREPRGKDASGVASYKWAFLYVQYTKLGCAILADADPAVTGGAGLLVPREERLARFVRKRRRNASRYMTSRFGGWKWRDNGLPVPMDIPWRQPRLRLLYTWLNIPIANLNQAYINDCIGTTNFTNFDGLPNYSCLLNGVDWPEYFPIPGQDGLQVDVTFDVIYFPAMFDSAGTSYPRGPNFFPDPARFNLPKEVGRTLAGIIVNPFPVRLWTPMFTPINV